MRIKAVCTDIDGTLLNKDRALSSRTIDVIRLIKERVPVVLASSRMPSAMTHLQKELGIEQHPMICFNGGYVLFKGPGATTFSILNSVMIPKAIGAAVLEVTRGSTIHVSLFSGNEWYAAAEDQWTSREAFITKVSPLIHPLADVIHQWERAGSGIHKIMCMGDASEIDGLYDLLFKNYSSDIHLYRSKNTYLEIAPKTISKSSALRSVMQEKFGLTLSEVMAFGDNFNDVDMIRDVGVGIAVANAIDEVKNVANEITSSGKEDGVAIALEKYFLA
jgi:hypothetical protein